MKYLVRKYSIFFEIEFLSDKYFIKRFCIDFLQINSTSSFTRVTILLDPKRWYVEMVVYIPASFVSMQISWKCKLIIKYGRHLSLIDLLTKSTFSKVILSLNFEILFLEKSGLEWNNCYLKFMIHSALFWRIMSLLTV